MDIKLINVSKKYHKNLKYSLENVSLEIKSGEKIGIIGPNGAGKTTLLSIISGLIQETSGSIEFMLCERKLSQKDSKSFIGVVPQDLAFYHDLSPLQNLEYFGALYNLEKNQIDLRSYMILNDLDLHEVRNNKINTFSGGMKRKVNIAIGLIHSPKVLLLDEATVGVDVKSRKAIISLLNKANQKGSTIIFSSHLLQEAESFCDRIILLNNGKIILNELTSKALLDSNTNSLEELFLKISE